MEELVKKDILVILKKALHYIKKHDILLLTELSNHTIHDASIFQDKDSVSIAVIVYALSKIMEREGGRLDKKVIGSIKQAYDSLSNNNTEAYKSSIRKLFEEISKIDTKLKLYIEEVINQAEIKKGSKLYEHGISLARAAEVLGISQWELMNYVGKTKIIERTPKETDIRRRIETARKLFNIR
jgi:hypothetical protein